MFQSRPWLTLLLVPVAVHWAALSGWLSADPLYLMSGLGEGWQGNGVVSGLPGWIDGNAGVTLQALGRLAADDWRAGIVPWWNPYSGVGMPLAGEMQPAAFFLPFMLLLGLGNGVLYLKIVLQVLAGLSCWGLLKHLKLSGTAALAGGVLFELNGTFAWEADSSFLPMAFLPLFLLGIERALSAARANEPGGWRLMSVAMSYALLAGFPERAYIDGLFALCWAGLRFSQASACRGAFAVRVALGGSVALLISAPVLLAFTSFLGQTEPALRAMGHTSLGTGDFAMFLFPYLYGPIFFHDLYAMWYRMGGYISLPMTFLTLAGLAGAVLRKTREQGLRVLLAMWIVLALCKSGGMAAITDAWNAVPMIGQTLFFRYSNSSWELCAILLGCLALDDLLTMDRPSRKRRFLFASASCAFLAACALAAGRPVWHDLGSVAGGRIWFYAALGWGLAATGIVALAWRAGARHAAVAILVADTILQFSVPLLSGSRGSARVIDTAPVDFLRANLELNRFYTLGPIPPNYGAFFRIAEINHNYAPVPQLWVDYIHAHLDPHANSITFNGSTPPPEPGVENRPDALRRRSAAFAAIGVKYVVTQPDADPFSLPPAAWMQSGAQAPLFLAPGERVTATIAPGQYAVDRIGSVQLRIGTLFGKATGRLVLRLCVSGNCASGSAHLEHAVDNAMLGITLDHALALSPSEDIAFDLMHDGGDTQAALWVRRGGTQNSAAVVDASGSTTLATPDMRVLPALGEIPHIVFRSKAALIYELSNPAPYFEAPGCDLSHANRQSVHVVCTAPAHLIRRELFFPGWRAKVSGHPLIISQAGLFQQINVPPGSHEVEFAFAPPHIVWAYAASLLGMTLLLAGAFARTTSLRGFRKSNIMPIPPPPAAPRRY